MILFLKVGNMLVDGILLANSCVASTEPCISCSALSPGNRLGRGLRRSTRVRDKSIAWCGGSSSRGWNDLNPGHWSLVSIVTAPWHHDMTFQTRVQTFGRFTVTSKGLKFKSAD